METLLGIIIVGGWFALGWFIYQFETHRRRVNPMLEWFERENLLLNDVLEWFEGEEPDSTPPDAPNAIKINSPKRDETADGEKPESEVDFWNNLAALKREQHNIESGDSDVGVFDTLDHARAVAERIAEIEESKLPFA